VDKLTPWTGKRIQQLRKALKESTATFGARLGKSGRTIEDWEQGRRNPDVLARRELDRLAKRLRKHQAAIEMGR
jgi:DNA-binding transcriptional regulator YiaG